ERQEGDRRQDGDPDRRRPDDGEHGRGLRPNAEARRRGPGGADHLGPGGAPDAVDALTTDLKYRGGKDALVPLVEIYTKSFCPYCWRAKALLDSKGVAYKEIAVDFGGAERQ